MECRLGSSLCHDLRVIFSLSDYPHPIHLLSRSQNTGVIHTLQHKTQKVDATHLDHQDPRDVLPPSKPLIAMAPRRDLDPEQG